MTGSRRGERFKAPRGAMVRGESSGGSGARVWRPGPPPTPDGQHYSSRHRAAPLTPIRDALCVIRAGRERRAGEECAVCAALPPRAQTQTPFCAGAGGTSPASCSADALCPGTGGCGDSEGRPPRSSTPHAARGSRRPPEPKAQVFGLTFSLSPGERERDGQGASDPRLWNILPAGPSNGAAGLAVYVEPIRRKLTLSVLWPAVRPSPSAYIEDSAFSASSLLPGRAFSVCVWVGKCRRTVASSLHLTR